MSEYLAAVAYRLTREFGRWFCRAYNPAGYSHPDRGHRDHGHNRGPMPVTKSGRR